MRDTSFLWLNKDIPEGTGPFSFVWQTSKPHRLPMMFSFLFVALGASMNTVVPYIYKIIVDGVAKIGNGISFETLVGGVVLFFGASLLQHAFWRLSGFSVMHWATGNRATARYSLTSYTIQHSHDYFANKFAGAISSKISNASNSIGGLIRITVWGLVNFIITITASLIVAYFANPFFALVLLGWIVFAALLNFVLAKKRVPLSLKAQEAETNLVGRTVDLLTNISASHEYAQQSYELDSLKTYIDKRRTTGRRNWAFAELTITLNGIIEIIFVTAAFLVAVYFAFEGRISPGDIVLLISLISLIQGRLDFINHDLVEMGDIWGQIKEGLNEIFQKHDIPDAPNAAALNKVAGKIDFKDMTFSYENTEVFKNFSLTIPAGQKVGLVGKSGAGKSTFVKLLLRHFDIQEGAIAVDEHNITDVTKDSLRKHIAIVPQEPLLFHRTIYENIAYGKEGATKEEVIEAARQAEAHDFIEKLPEGYESKVGERGIKLSGGQRQRIAIARAILKNAPILILDEATSALDSESEGLVQKALLKVMEGRTVIAVAHRLSTLRAMDRILVLEDGAISEDGSHEELIENGGTYAELWAHQAGGFLKEEE